MTSHKFLREARKRAHRDGIPLSTAKRRIAAEKALPTPRVFPNSQTDDLVLDNSRDGALAWVPGNDAKTGEPVCVPLSRPLMLLGHAGAGKSVTAQMLSEQFRTLNTRLGGEAIDIFYAAPLTETQHRELAQELHALAVDLESRTKPAVVIVDVHVELALSKDKHTDSEPPAFIETDDFGSILDQIAALVQWLACNGPDRGLIPVVVQQRTAPEVEKSGIWDTAVIRRLPHMAVAHATVDVNTYTVVPPTPHALAQF